MVTLEFTCDHCGKRCVKDNQWAGRKMRFCNLKCWSDHANKPRTIPAELRFWPRVNKTESCWLWTGDTYKSSGYGRIWADGKNISTHRLSIQLANPGLKLGRWDYVCHACHNKLCVRPDHLYVGTPADNMRDRHAVGRYAAGSMHHNAKINEETVREIRAMNAAGETFASIGRKIGLNENNVGLIVKRRAWKHVD